MIRMNQPLMPRAQNAMMAGVIVGQALPTAQALAGELIQFALMAQVKFRGSAHSASDIAEAEAVVKKHTATIDLLERELARVSHLLGQMEKVEKLQKAIQQAQESIRLIEQELSNAE